MAIDTSPVQSSPLPLLSIRMASIPLEWIRIDWSPMEPLQSEVGPRERPGPSWCETGGRFVAGVGFPAPVS